MVLGIVLFSTVSAGNLGLIPADGEFCPLRKRPIINRLSQTFLSLCETSGVQNVGRLSQTDRMGQAPCRRNYYQWVIRIKSPTSSWRKALLHTKPSSKDACPPMNIPHTLGTSVAHAIPLVVRTPGPVSISSDASQLVLSAISEVIDIHRSRSSYVCWKTTLCPLKMTEEIVTIKQTIQCSSRNLVEVKSLGPMGLKTI